MKKIFIATIISLIAITSFAQKKILFDNTKSETAGNADWIIDDNQPVPSPAQSGITQSTTEDYWQGALSSWGVEMVKRGYYVETLPSSGEISYNDANNSQDLSNYDIFIVCEPNNPFSSTEKQAMIDFVQNGGGLFMVSDHGGTGAADRDGDGWYAVNIWNDFFADYNNPFGFTFNEDNTGNIDPATNIANLPSNTILHGTAGDVDGIAFYSGGSITLDNTSNSSAVGLVYMDGYSTTGTTGIMAVYAEYGNGKIVAVGDSSVPEDETNTGGTTYPGWYQPYDAGDATGDDGVFMTNATIWLGESSTNPKLTVSSSNLTGLDYTPGNGPSNSQYFNISGSNLDGSQISISAPTDYEISLNNSTFSSSLNISYTAPTLSSTTIYVRLKSGLPNGDYNGTITCDDNGSASNKIINVSGNVGNPPIELLNENFTTCPSSNWTNYSVASSKDWSCDNTNQAMEANAYGGDIASNDWLISPLMDFSNLSSATLNFDSYTKYADAGISTPELKVKYSTNYSGTGNPENSTWTNLSYTFPSENSQTWTSSGDIDLSSINSSNVYIAFQYTSSGTDGNSSTLWEIDNIIINGETASSGYTISANANPSNSGTISGTGFYSENANVSLTATAETGYHFVNWTDNGTEVSTNTNYSFTATADRNLMANFEINTYSISASANNSNYGTISGDGNFSYGDNVSLTATAETGYHFVNWTELGIEVSTNSTYNFTATADRNLIANFAQATSIIEKKYNLIIYPNPVINNKITISSDNYLEKKIVIINTDGKVIKTNSFVQKNKEIELSNLNSGIYFIKITTNNNIIWKKIIL